jgi:hypothetical protein
VTFEDHAHAGDLAAESMSELHDWSLEVSVGATTRALGLQDPASNRLGTPADRSATPGLP